MITTIVHYFVVAGGKAPLGRSLALALRIVAGKLTAAGGRDRNQARPEETSIRRRVPTLIPCRSPRASASYVDVRPMLERASHPSTVT